MLEESLFISGFSKTRFQDESSSENEGENNI